MTEYPDFELPSALSANVTDEYVRILKVLKDKEARDMVHLQIHIGCLRPWLTNYADNLVLRPSRRSMVYAGKCCRRQMVGQRSYHLELSCDFERSILR